MPLTARHRIVFILAIGLGALWCAIFWAIARFHADNSQIALAQPDSLIFLHYAHAMAEGRPYQFAPGDRPSTGGTSHLYPAILSLLCRAGARDDALPAAGFLLNAAFYLAFLGLAWIVAARLDPGAAPLAILLAAVNGQSLYTCLGQTDMGLFMALSMAALAAAAHGRYFLLAIALAACAWCRPEGAVLSLAWIAAAFLPWPNGAPRRLAAFLAGAAGLVCFVMVLGLNMALTGTAVFQSLIGKGLWTVYPPAAALRHAAANLGEMTREVLFGMAGGGRQFYTVPVAGGLLGLFGLVTRDWKTGRTARPEAWWAASACAVLILVAFSGWSGIGNDRYLGWLIPVWLIYVAVGARAAAARFAWTRAYTLLGLALVAYQAVGLVYFGSIFAENCARLESHAAFCRRVEELTPPNARIGVNGLSGLAYYMPNRAVANINGVVTPAFANGPFPVCNAELLKHSPSLRFDHWLFLAPDAASQWFSVFVGSQIAAESPAFGGDQSLALHGAAWDLLDGPATPRSPEVLDSLKGWDLIDTLDVGYQEDEARCGYSVHTRLAGARIQPFLSTGQAGERAIAEVGRVVLGAETFHVRARVGKPIRVAMRTAARATAPINVPGADTRLQDFQFASPIALRLFADGQPASEARIELPGAAEEFGEAVLDVPGESVTSDPVELTVGGDHVAFAYWFYQ